MTRLAILNPHARGARGDQQLGEIVAWLDANGIAHRQIVDHAGSQPVEAALAGLRSGDCLIAFGGDGTINALLPTVLRSGATLAVYPMGTQNNLAQRVGMPADLQTFADILERGEVRKLGLGSVNDRPFATLVSIGAGSVAARLQHRYRRPLGLVQRFWRSGLTWLPFVCAVAFHPLDRLEVMAMPPRAGVPPPENRLVVPAVYVSALDQTNGGMSTTALKGIDRHSLAVSLTTSFARLEVLAGYQEVFRRNSWRHPMRGLHAFDTPRITVRSLTSEPLAAYGDGELLLAATSFEIACLPSALEIVVNPALQA